MNVFPSAIEQVLREAGGVGEFPITFYTDPVAMDEVKIEAELDDPRAVREIQARLRHQLSFKQIGEFFETSPDSERHGPESTTA